MSKTALVMKITVKPGKREEVRRIWEKYVKPRVQENENQEYYYCYAKDNENVIFQIEFFNENFKLSPGDWHKSYEKEVEPLLSAPNEYLLGEPLWEKGFTSPRQRK